mmetsp:Transcript_18844/g.19093  ORF Transcript_18844/g.19093 Transcript_18844/m.19093 type:complete len:266 (-) Transcript_18844:463-1260(-)
MMCGKLTFITTAGFFLAVTTKNALAFTNNFRVNQTPFSNTVKRSKAIYSTPTGKSVTLDNKPIRGPITPLGNFILVRPKDTLSATEGGILLPDQAQERPTEGEVVCAGPGRIHPQTGKRMTHSVTEGVRVLHAQFTGSPFIYNDEELTMIRDDDVMLYYTGSVQMTIDNVMIVRDYVLVELAAAKLETASGIAIAGGIAREFVPCEGKVMKVGEGRLTSEGTVTKIPLNVGDEVKFKDYSGNEIKIQGRDYCLVKMEDMLCSIEA